MVQTRAVALSFSQASIVQRFSLRPDLDVRVYESGVISNAPSNFRASNFRKLIFAI
jgi:hypothetical protein